MTPGAYGDRPAGSRGDRSSAYTPAGRRGGGRSDGCSLQLGPVPSRLSRWPPISASPSACRLTRRSSASSTAARDRAWRRRSDDARPRACGRSAACSTISRGLRPDGARSAGAVRRLGVGLDPDPGMSRPADPRRATRATALRGRSRDPPGRSSGRGASARPAALRARSRRSRAPSDDRGTTARPARTAVRRPGASRDSGARARRGRSLRDPQASPERSCHGSPHPARSTTT